MSNNTLPSNAESDAIQGNEPDWQQFHKCEAYRIRYTRQLLAEYRRLNVDVLAGKDADDIIFGKTQPETVAHRGSGRVSLDNVIDIEQWCNSH